MVTRTARGTASDKTSGASLTIPSFTVPAGHSLVVGAGYDNAQLAPSTVLHAGRHLRRKIQRDDATNGFHASVWLKGEYNKEQTGTCVLTWGASIGKKAAVASSYDRVHKEDDDSSNIQAATTSPGTGQTGASVTAGSFVVGVRYEIETVGTTDFTLIGSADNNVGTLFVATGAGSGTGTARSALDSDVAMACCFFIAEGPSSDHGSATAQIEDGGTFQTATIGQTAGTAGAPPVSNITIIETFLELTTFNPTRGRLQNATSRNWISMAELIEPRAARHKLAVSPTDFNAVDEIVTAAGGDPDDVYFGVNADGIIEAYETTTPGTLRATYDPETGFWNNVGSP